MAKDKAGNRSAPARATVATSACADVTPPSAPTSFRWIHDDVFGDPRLGCLDGQRRRRPRTASTMRESWSWRRRTEAGASRALRAARPTRTTSMRLTARAIAPSKVPATITTLACADGQPPTKPAPVTVLDATPSAVTVSWPTATDNVGVDHYNVYRGATPIAETTSTSTTVTGLSCGTSYSIGVNAEDGAGNASDMASTVAQTDPCASPADTQPPSAPRCPGCDLRNADVDWPDVGPVNGQRRRDRLHGVSGWRRGRNVHGDFLHACPVSRVE